MDLEVGVTSAKHRGEPCDLHLTTFAFAGFLVVAMISDFPQCAFPVDSFFESAEGFFH